MEKTEILNWLREHDKSRLKELWLKADGVRRESVGDEVHLRGLIEISNHCVRKCAYCGLNAGNTNLSRYRMTEPEIMDCVRQAELFGYGTVVIQSGEDYGIDTDWLAAIISRIKNSTSLVVTLGMGERPFDDLKAWRDAGADRYLLRFETSDQRLYQKIHPPRPGQSRDRFDILDELIKLGYETGSGVMIGIPGQSYETLAQDIDLFQQFDLYMIGVGPYIAHPDTLLAREGSSIMLADGCQVPGNELMVYKIVALARLVCPHAHIPGTTALGVINQAQGQALALVRGANVIMPNLTPLVYRHLYEIYPEKALINETTEHARRRLAEMVSDIGRRFGGNLHEKNPHIEPI